MRPAREAASLTPVQDRLPDIERRRNLLLELLKTEETYVKRLHILYKVKQPWLWSGRLDTQTNT